MITTCRSVSYRLVSYVAFTEFTHLRRFQGFKCAWTLIIDYITYKCIARHLVRIPYRNNLCFIKDKKFPCQFIHFTQSKRYQTKRFYDQTKQWNDIYILHESNHFIIFFSAQEEKQRRSIFLELYLLH